MKAPAEAGVSAGGTETRILRPKVLQVVFDRIPKELASRDQWVVWRLEAVDDRYTKVPYRAQAPNAKASSTDPASWASFDAARAAYEAGHADGVGFVLRGEDGLVGLDLDNCRDCATGHLAVWAEELITRLDSYTELSPSGTGIRIFVKGQLKVRDGQPTGRSRSKKGDLEFYDGLTADLRQGGRFLTVTGHVASDRGVMERQGTLEYLYDETFDPPRVQPCEAATAPGGACPESDPELVARIRASRQGHRFECLWAGDTSDYARDANDGHSEADLALCSMLAWWTDYDRPRIDRLFRQSGLYRPKWERQDYRERTLERAMDGQQQGDGFVGGKTHGAVAPGPGEPRADIADDVSSPAPNTDRANAHRLKKLLSDRLIHVPGIGWHEYSKGLWRRVTEEHVAGLAMAVLGDEVRREAAEVLDRARYTANGAQRKELDQHAEKLIKWAIQSEMKRPVDHAVAAFKPMVEVKPEQLDADPWLLNVENGVLELKTQTLREHRRRDYMTKRAPIVFDPEVTSHPAVDALLDLLKRDGCEEYLGCVLGSSLAGEVPNEKVFMLVGGAGTGKSTLMEAVMAVMGDYAKTIDMMTIIESRLGSAGGARADLLGLKGARLAVARELPKNARLNAAEIKGLTGGDSITARAPYAKEAVTFRPTFTLVVHSNYAPRGEWDDEGVQRRLVHIPFDAKPAKADPNVKLQLLNDPVAQQVVLNWLLVGLAIWLEGGFELDEPEIIRKATSDYWTSTDPFSEWAACKLGFAQECVTQTGTLYESYLEWCKTEGIQRPHGRVSLGKWLAKQPGTESTTIGKAGAKAWKGVGLLADAE